MNSITPTIGRKVYYTPSAQDFELGMTLLGGVTHVDASIVYVHDDGRTVNLAVNDHLAKPYLRTCSIGDDAVSGCAHWMPFQLGQAKPAPITGDVAPDPADPADPAVPVVGNVVGD